MKIGKKIKFYRQRLNMSQKELAKKANISQASLHYIENDVNSPTVASLDKISKALDVQISELLDDKSN